MRALGVTIAILLIVPLGAASASPGKSAFAVTLGSTDGDPNANACVAGISCTYVPSVAALAPSLVAPFSGTVTGFSVNSGSGSGTVALRALRGDGSGAFLGVRGSPAVPLVLGLNTYKVLVPVQKGDVLALDNDSSALIFTTEFGDPLDITAYFQPALVEGQTDQPNEVVTGKRLLLSATIESTPPEISAFTQSVRTWRESTHVPRRLPVGTRFTFAMNEDVTGSLIFKRGARVAGRLGVDAKAGRHSLRFSGLVLSGNLLKPGRYSVRLSVSNDAGDESTSRALTFRIAG